MLGTDQLISHVLTVNCRINDQVTVFHLTCQVSRTHRHALLTWSDNGAVQLIECTLPMNHSEYWKTEVEFEFIDQTSNF